MSDELIYEQEEVRGFNCKVVYDPDPTSPDDWDTLGTIYSNSRSYNPQNHRIDEILVEDEEGNNHIDPDYIYVNIYAYIHSGVALSCSRGGQFSDPWDSGLFGVMACERSKAEKEFGDLNVPENMERVLKCLEGEVECWDCYYQGRVFGYEVVDENDDVVDSCWGFYDYDGAKEAMEEAKGIAEYRADKIEKENADRRELVKANILLLVGDLFPSFTGVYRVSADKMFGLPIIEVAKEKKGRVREEFFNQIDLQEVPDEVIEEMAGVIQ